MIPCVSLTETSVLGNMKERVREMRVFGCRLNFWQNVTNNISNKGMCSDFHPVLMKIEEADEI